MKGPSAITQATDSLIRTKWYFVLHRQRFGIIVKTVCQLLYGKPSASVLEVGVWPGYLALAIQYAGFHVKGVDLEPHRLEPLRKFGIPLHGVDLNQTSTLPFENDSSDCIIVSEVIEHLNPHILPELFRELRRVLKAGGYLILTTPNKLQLGNLLRPWNWNTNRITGHGHGHWKEYGLSEIVRLLHNEGYGVRTAERRNFYLLVGRNNDGTYYYPLYALWRGTNWLHNALKLLLWPMRQIPTCKDSLFLIAEKR